MYMYLISSRVVTGQFTIHALKPNSKMYREFVSSIINLPDEFED